MTSVQVAAKHLVEMIRERLLEQYEVYPFRSHPYWREVASGALTRAQVQVAERQHLLQVAALSRLRGRSYFGVSNAAAFEFFLDEYMSSLGTRTPEQMLAALLPATEEGTPPTSGTSASIALREALRGRGFELYAVGFGIVADQMSEMFVEAHRAYQAVYRFQPTQLEFYKAASSAEATRSGHVAELLRLVEETYNHEALEVAVRDAVTSISLGLDGMYQSAHESREYWGGHL